MKREGDGATPVGRWHPLAVYYRPDRLPRPKTQIPIFRIQSSSGWCDEPTDRNYNRPVRLPYPASAENLWRDDHLYDLIVILDHNCRPRIRGLGSAIFIHVARPGFAPTEGCIALAPNHLRQLISSMDLRTEIVVG